jgi:site-specific recombinase XerD
MKVEDVLYEKRKPQSSYQLREQKTGKTKKFPLGKNVQKAIEAFLSDFQGNREEILFTSRKGENTPITRQQAWRIINQAALNGDH